MDREREVLALERELKDRTYQPRPYRTFTITLPKHRLISAADFRDRVVHHALCAALEPTLERYAIADSFACRPGKGMLAALQRLRHFAGRSRYALRLDVHHFFATIDHEVLAGRLARRIHDPDLRWLISTFLAAGAPGSPPGKGLPVGNLTSQHFANFYLGALDRKVKQGLRCRGYVRYMDDMVVLGDDKAELWQFHKEIEHFAATTLCLELNPARLAPVTEGIPFLGFRVWPGLVRFGPKTRRRWLRRMRGLTRAVDHGVVSEEDGQRIVAGLLGWAAHANAPQHTWSRRR